MFLFRESYLEKNRRRWGKGFDDEAKKVRRHCEGGFADEAMEVRRHCEGGSADEAIPCTLKDRRA